MTADLYKELDIPDGPPPPARLVLHQDGTSSQKPLPRDISPEGVDALFDGRAAYTVVKHEKPEHRLMLWYRLRGMSPGEIASLTGYTVVHVRNICAQPWFRSAFARLADEMGRDIHRTFLEGEVMPALQNIVKLANESQSEVVKLAANREILDRFLGKSVAKTETKVEGQIDTVVYSAEKLLEEQRRLAQALKDRGIGTN